MFLLQNHGFTFEHPARCGAIRQTSVSWVHERMIRAWMVRTAHVQRLSSRGAASTLRTLDARKAPEVVTSEGLRPRPAPQSLRLPPASGCPPMHPPVRVIGMQSPWDARRLPFDNDCLWPGSPIRCRRRKRPLGPPRVKRPVFEALTSPSRPSVDIRHHKLDIRQQTINVQFGRVARAGDQRYSALHSGGGRPAAKPGCSRSTPQFELPSTLAQRC